MAFTIANWFLKIFGSTYLSVFFISIIPMIEVRGAIPIGVTMGMNIWVSYVFATLSALVIAPVLIVILKPILKCLKKTKVFKKVATAIEEMFSDKANRLEGRIARKTEKDEIKTVDIALQKTEERKTIWKKMFGIFLFVAVPLPLTGVWTGTAVAVFLNMKWYQILPPIVLGNFVAGAMITALTVALGDKVSIILYVLFAFVLIGVAVMLFGMYQRAKKRRRTAEEMAKTTKSDEAKRKD